jgi:hypothetical protein
MCYYRLQIKWDYRGIKLVSFIPVDIGQGWTIILYYRPKGSFKNGRGTKSLGSLKLVTPSHLHIDFFLRHTGIRSELIIN